MRKTSSTARILRPLKKFLKEVSDFFSYIYFYCRGKTVSFSAKFEQYKNILVKLFMIKRGRYNRPFLHLAVIGVLILGVAISPVLSSSFPVFSSSAQSPVIDEESQDSIAVGDDVFETQVSAKPRDSIIVYTVRRGDTISTIAEKFGISEDTVRWANDLEGNNLSIGEELDILPVSGISHKVASGDTVYSIAKKYDTSAQKIVNFIFNEFANPETFSLVEGQILIVPDGVKPSEIPTRPKREVFVAQGPTSVSSSGFGWPVSGVVAQFASWYHNALDILGDVGTPIVASSDGVVVKVSTGAWEGGYGNHVIVDHGGGMSTLYAHMSSVNVSAGQRVVGGSTVLGAIGMTGRTTGPHVHFEVRQNGATRDPMGFLR